MYSFNLNCFNTISQKCKINVQFKPALSDKEIKEEANNIAEREKEKLKQAESLAKLAVEPTIVSAFYYIQIAIENVYT